MTTNDELKEDKTEGAHKVLTCYLIANKKRKTPERYTILDAAFHIPSPFDIEEITTEILKGKIKISLSTIYNTILLLEKAHLLVRSKQNGRYTKYMVNNDFRAQSFLICNSCGKVRQIQNEKLSHTLHNLRFAGFQAERFTLCIYGICTSCRIKQNKKTNQKPNSSYEKRKS